MAMEAVCAYGCIQNSLRASIDNIVSKWFLPACHAGLTAFNTVFRLAHFPRLYWRGNKVPPEAMSISFKPKYVPSDVIARWPSMALSLWKRSFSQQTVVLLAASLLTKLLPAWSTVIGFLIAPSLFIVSFAAVQIADERTAFSWMELIDLAHEGVMRLGRVTLQFAVWFGLGIAALASLSSLFVSDPSAAELDEPLRTLPAATMDVPQNLMLEFLHFCVTWTEGVMTMIFLGMFIVVIYQGVFGAVLHAQEGMGPRESRLLGWQAWQVNSKSIEQALLNAPLKFWGCMALVALAVVCAFQTVYLSPVGLILATYIPCFAYVAYRSIFFGKHENVPVSARTTAVRMVALIPALR